MGLRLCRCADRRAQDTLPHVVFKDSPEQPDYRVVFVRGKRCTVATSSRVTTLRRRSPSPLSVVGLAGRI